MSLRTTVHNLNFRRIYKDVYNEKSGIICMSTVFNGKTYTGTAYCCDEDMPFFSEKIGCNIACFRGMIDIFKDEEERAKIAWHTLKNLYCNTENYYDIDFADPYGIMAYSVVQAKELYLRYMKYRKDEERNLRHYLENHKKALNIIIKSRSMPKEDLGKN